MTLLARLERVRALTFDCYGTLIDWDGGIATAVRAVPSLAGCDVERFLVDRERIEGRWLEGPFRSYGEVLAGTLRETGRLHGREVSEDEAHAFAASMATWPPFPDTHEALERLKGRFRLAILSNVEIAVLRASVVLLGVDFELLLTAQELESYKPHPRHFEEGRRRLGLTTSGILHVAGSLYHDVGPASELGFTTAWINRRGDEVPADLPGLVFPDLAALADAVLS